jgi:ribosomal protein S18 acetylase RimI-like enzyme
MSHAWRLRDGRFEDLPALTTIDARAFAELALEGDAPYSYGSFRQLFDLFAALLLVAGLGDGTPAGHALGGVGVETEAGWVLGVAVDLPFQRAGIGRALVSTLCERMRRLGLREVRVMVHPAARSLSTAASASRTSR